MGQHQQLTLEMTTKILPPLMPELEPATFRSRVWPSTTELSPLPVLTLGASLRRRRCAWRMHKMHSSLHSVHLAKVLSIFFTAYVFASFCWVAHTACLPAPWLWRIHQWKLSTEGVPLPSTVPINGLHLAT